MLFPKYYEKYTTFNKIYKTFTLCQLSYYNQKWLFLMKLDGI